MVWNAKYNAQKNIIHLLHHLNLLDLNSDYMQGIFSDTTLRDLLSFWTKFSLKFAKWEEKSQSKM